MPATWEPHEIEQLNGSAERVKLPAKIQIVTESWRRVVAVPSIAYIPEQDRVLMLVSCDNPHQAMVLTNDNRGATWSEPKYVLTDGTGESYAGLGVGLAYVGRGRAVLWASRYWHTGAEARQWVQWTSDDYGETWSPGAPLPPPVAAVWDSPMVDRDPETGGAARLWQTAYVEDHSRPVWSQAYLRQSVDEGRTWDEWVEVPQWEGTNEVAVIRAANGDLVAACRTDMPEKFVERDPETGAVIRALDHYEGLGVSISHDEGRTWSEVEKLYDWGRHHQSMVLMPDGSVVMTYVVRKGYVDTPEGYPQFGVEAVVSHDNGRTWDLDHRDILDAWPGNRTDARWSWTRSSQATSSALLPDGSILTAFGTGYRAIVPDDEPQKFSPRDVGLVNWRVNNEGLNDDRTIANAPADSDLRNRLVP